MNSWITNSIFYHIYPLGFCGTPKENNEAQPVNRISKVIDIIPHLKSLSVNAIYFGPLFQSKLHGTYKKEELKKGWDILYNNGIRVIPDGVFNHVGRDFFALKMYLKKA